MSAALDARVVGEHRPPVLTRPIRWDLIAQQYDQMIRYATALRLGTAESEQVLRRFTRGGPKHPRLRRPGRTRPGRAHDLRVRPGLPVVSSEKQLTTG